MTAKSTKHNSSDGHPSLTLPPGLSPEEEARWWDEHHDYWQGQPYEVVPPQPIRSTAPVTLRLPVDTVEALQAEAARRGLVYQTLIRVWLEERLQAEALSHR